MKTDFYLKKKDIHTYMYFLFFAVRYIFAQSIYLINQTFLLFLVWAAYSNRYYTRLSY